MLESPAKSRADSNQGKAMVQPSPWSIIRREIWLGLLTVSLRVARFLVVSQFGGADTPVRPIVGGQECPPHQTETSLGFPKARCVVLAALIAELWAQHHGLEQARETIIVLFQLGLHLFDEGLI